MAISRGGRAADCGLWPRVWNCDGHFPLQACCFQTAGAHREVAGKVARAQCAREPSGSIGDQPIRVTMADGIRRRRRFNGAEEGPGHGRSVSGPEHERAIVTAKELPSNVDEVMEGSSHEIELLW